MKIEIVDDWGTPKSLTYLCEYLNSLNLKKEDIKKINELISGVNECCIIGAEASAGEDL